MAKSYEELKAGFDRIAAAQACRNLMGKYSYLHTAFRNKEYVALWADREDDLLVMPWGYYKGKKGVETCYLKDHGDRSDPGKLDDPMFKGGMMMHAMDTCCLEVAGDGQTARGCWISPGHESCYLPDLASLPAGWKPGDPVPEGTPRTASCQWAWSKYYVEFIKENGEWKFWKLRLWPIFRTDFYTSWTDHPELDDGDFAGMSSSPLPKRNWEWSADAVYPADEPEPPLPYEHYEDSVPALWKDYV